MKRERPLCDLERAFWLLDRGTRMNGLGVVWVRSETALKPEHIEQGLLRLQARHPLLRMRITGEDRSPRLTEEGAGPLPLRVLWLQPAPVWQKLVEEELNRSFDREADHLSRVTLVVSTDDDEDAGGPQRSLLILTHHHVIADALSIAFVARDLLTQVAASMGDAAPEAVGPLPLLPPLPELLPRAARGLARFAQMNAFFQKNIAKSTVRNARKLPIEEPAPPEARHNRVVHRTLTKAELEALDTYARAQGASVHGALCAALLLAATTVAYAEELAAGTATTIGCFTAVNLRERLEPPVGTDLGLFISQVTTFHQVVPLPPLWQLAQEVKAQLKETLASGEQYLTLPMIGLFIPWGKDPGPRFIRRFDGGSPAALGVSNLARPPIPRDYGRLRIENIHFAAGVSVVSQLMCVASTWEQELNLNLVFAEPLLSRARVEQIADGALTLLRAATASKAACSTHSNV